MNRFKFLVLLFWGAVALRLSYDGWLGPDLAPVPLRVPFSELPMDIVGVCWSGEDVPLDKDSERVAKVTAYVQRRYRRPGQELWLYVGYVSGRVPDAICFPGSGLILTTEEQVTLIHADLGRALRFKESQWRNPLGGGAYSLSTFYYNGRFEPEAHHLLAERILGVRYFAVITISCSFMGSPGDARQYCQDAVQEAMPSVLRHFPDEVQNERES